MGCLPQGLGVGQEQVIVVGILIVRIGIGHSHDIQDVGIRRDRVPVPVLRRHPDILKGIDGPGGRIVGIMPVILGIVAAQHAALGLPQALGQLSRGHVRIVVHAADPVLIPGHQDLEGPSCLACSLIRRVCILREHIGQV